MPPLIRWSVDVRRENDIPELRRGGKELDGKQRSFLIHLRRTDHIYFDLLLRLRIFEGELRALRKAFGKNDHRPRSADRMRKPIDGLRFPSKVRDDRHPQQNPLRAAPFLGGGLPRRRPCGTHPAD